MVVIAVNVPGLYSRGRLSLRMLWRRMHAGEGARATRATTASL